MAHVERRNGRWRARYRDRNNNERSKTFDRKVDAQAFLAAVQTDIRRGQYVDPMLGRIHLAAWTEDFLDGAHDLSPTSLATYRRDMEKYVLPHFGSTPLIRIAKADVRRWITEELAAGIAPSSVRRHFATLRLILNAAVAHDLIVKSPCAGLKGPAVPHQEMRFLTHDEIDALVDAINPRYRVMILVGAYAGLRWSEIIGLPRRSVDLDGAAVTVVEQLLRIGGEWQRRPPKSAAGRRRISLPAFVVEELRVHLDAHVGTGPDDLVFTNEAGNPIHQSSFQTHHWKPAKARAGLELRFHDLRHTAVAVAIAAGAHPKAIQARLGHSSVALTLDRYGHLFPELDTEIGCRLDETWRGRRP